MLFSERYLRPEILQDDSKRLRVQLAAFFQEYVPDRNRDEVAKMLRLKSGTEIPYSYGYAWEMFFPQNSLRDVLDAITVAYEVLMRNGEMTAASRWLEAIQFAFDVQHVKYRIDLDGSVLLRVDEAFEVGRASALTALDIPRYAGARAEFSASYRSLSALSADGKHAVRSIFEACEVVFKLMFPSARRLAAPELGQHLSPLVADHYQLDTPAREAANKLVQSFTDWVAAAQFYRHGQGQEEPNQPPLELAISILSSGAGHIRWLIHLDQVKHAS